MSRTRLTFPRGAAYDPWAHADALGIEVVVRPLRTGHELWLPEYQTLLVNSRIRGANQRIALSHGVAHADLKHEDDRPKHEHQADILAGWNLIDPDHLKDLYKWCPDEQRIIHELGVTTRIFRAFVAAGSLEIPSSPSPL